MKAKFFPLLWMVPAAFILAGGMLFIFNSGQRLATQQRLLGHAATEIRLQGTNASLLFPKALVVESGVSIQVVWDDLTKAEWHADAMLHGDESRGGEVVPLRDMALQTEVRSTATSLEGLRSAMEERWQAQAHPEVQAKLDQELSQAFRQFQRSADSLDIAFESTSSQFAQDLQFWHRAIFLLVGVFLAFVSWLLLRYQAGWLKALEELQNVGDRLARAQGIAHIGSWDLNLKTNALWWSGETFEIFEVDSKRFGASYEAFLELIHPADRDRVQKAYDDSVVNRKAYDIVHRLQFQDNREKVVREHCQTFYDESGKPARSVGSVQDITKEWRTEEALRRSQKMDALGQLTGGIAHDFNNILGIMIGNIDLLRLEGEGNPEVVQRAAALGRAAQRAADITKQLLNFSRRQSEELSIVNVNQEIEQMEDLIRRSLTPQVETHHYLNPDLGLVEIDPGDFQDALLNLVLNARDAMDSSGEFTVETSNAVLDEAYCSLNPEVAAGDYIRIAVSDTGCGMPHELLPKVFDPFFTTKEQGKGTGLGLAMVYGFVNRAGGHIKVYSEPGLGTTFNLYLPRTEKESAVAPEFNPIPGIVHGHGTILVVDDEVELVSLAKEGLEHLGYQVLTANHAAEALGVLAANPTIDLLFTDVVMPGGMNGYELAEEATRTRPELKVLLTSGFTGRALARNGQARFQANLLGKPYTQADMTERIGRLLRAAIEPDSSIS